MKRIYPPLNSGPLFFTLSLKLGLDILWLPHSPIYLQYAQVFTPKMLNKLSQEALHQYSKIYSHKNLSIDPQKG